MSRLSLRDLVKEGKSALEDKHYWSALSLALMLPSICGRIEFENDSSYYDYKNDKKVWHDKKVYLSWCKRHLIHFHPFDYWFDDPIDVAEVLYMLRCGFIHEGNADLKYKSKIIFLANSSSISGVFADRLIIDVNSLCNFIFEIVSHDSFLCSQIYSYIFDIHNSDDRLVYDRLDNEAKSDFLYDDLLEYEKKKYPDKQ